MTPTRSDSTFDWLATDRVCGNHRAQGGGKGEPCHHPADHPGPCSWAENCHDCHDSGWVCIPVQVGRIGSVERLRCNCGKAASF